MEHSTTQTAADQVGQAEDAEPLLGVGSDQSGATAGGKEALIGPARSEPSVEVKPVAPKPVSVAQLFRYADCKDKCLIAVGLFASLLASFVFPIEVLLFGRATDAMTTFALNKTTDDNAELLSESMDLFVYGSLCTAAFQQLMSLTYVFCLYYTASDQACRIKQLFLRSALRQDMSWYDTKQMGDFTTRVTDDLKKIEDGIGEKNGMMVGFVMLFVLGMGLAFYNGWKLTLVVSSFTPVMVVSGALLAKLQASYAQKEADAYSQAGSVAEEVIGAIRTVKAFGGEQSDTQRFAERLQGARQAMVRRSAVTGLGVGLAWLVEFSSFALAFWYGTKLVLESRQAGDGLYTAGNITVVFFGILIGAMTVGQAVPHMEALSAARGAAATVYSVIEHKSKIDPSDQSGAKPDNVEGVLELKDVYFNYPSRPDTQVLRGMSFTVRPGQTVALVGSSGCGKSTCIQLIQRFYDPLQGQVLLDGRSLSELNVSWLRRQIGVVSQEPVLFGTTIAENIRYGALHCTMRDIEQAAKEANAFDFIQDLPQKFDTMVGQKGAQLSGGQKQRIAIARALVRNPKVFLLDEATSALDLQSEALVQSALDRARSGRTTIVVAHRLSTVRTADLICTLKDGKVAEMGSHEQLMQQQGVYYSLVTRQTGIKADDDDEQEDEEFEETVGDLQSARQPSAAGRVRLRTVSSSTSDHTDGVADSVEANGAAQAFRSASGKGRHESLTAPSEDEEDKLAPVSGWRILTLNSKEWPFLLLGVLGAAVMGAAIPGYAILMGIVLGNLSLGDPEEAMANARSYSLLFLSAGVVTFLASFTEILMFGIAGERLTTRVRKLTFAALLRQEVSFYDNAKNTVGALCARLSGDASSLQGATGTRLGNITRALFTVLLGAVLAFVLSWKLALAALPFVPLCLVATYMEGYIEQMHGSMDEDLFNQESGNQIAVEAISNIRTVAGLGLEELVSDQYAALLRTTRRKYIKKAFVRGLVYGAAQSVPTLAYAAVFGVAKPLILDGTLPYASLFMVSESLIYGTMVVGSVVAFSPDFSKAFGAAKRIFALLERKPAIDSSLAGGVTLPKVTGTIGLHRVRFRYPTRPEATVLSDLSLEISPGQQVALVGSSGCGKSTCIQLLERFYDPEGGDVTVDGQSVSALNLSWLRSNIGIVSQEPVLFDKTIRENIAYGDNSREVPMEEIIAAARDANIHSFVASLPAGYETQLGSSSSTQLSGGQKQRIAIARALVRRPAILLLDEATSALDAESEKCVQEALERAASGRTCLVIAHRLSTIQDADKIAVIHHGRVVEQGTHQELLSKKGMYYKLYKTMA
ncbi:ATP-dependent translocase ABCB1-like [Pollicipes pollicipes]|uniref:ATP-dependent translocase ABCB1-like n=1 Tax=Pollicipes pollicipes TaxID=41117 RepID=UPI001884ECC8|nr:ATP-dependent translocase ABCB1-like [Pollicipes pollicipes]